MPNDTPRTGPIRLGMVGGGQGAFIGAVHRIAARLDGRYQLVAGALSSTPEKSQASGAELGLDPKRIYDDFKQMAIREARLKDGIEAVAIVTPNHMHVDPAIEFLRRGIHVICDKPLAPKLGDARRLARVCEKSDALFVLTHNYSGYPLIRQAREMVANGDLGDIRLVQVEYVQDWLSTDLETTGNKQAEWRTDPARSGAGGATGDIGTHAFQLARFVSGLELDELAADLDSFGKGRTLDDNAHVMLRWKGGAKGMLWCSQVAPGNENALRLRIYGTKCGLSWEQENPNRLWHTPLGEPPRLLTRAGAGSTDAANRLTRTPGGHPEGYLEGFANIYSEAATAIEARRTGAPVPPEVTFPGIADGLEGVAFVEACVKSGKANGNWKKLGL
ncbi:Gfo/Idh/MocA family protein [Pseudoruegeria sp. HB172150]|uniref:Gfo/Idh/MocA family protein n=1 Tax=Pseudoruegeria sp. HB172150 TaxID=2721164 RepID=UPI0015547134|nr:Gfo/Idh/MocA family oxidoreductase [Pseudoruegeria sp. HB172150]